MSSGRPSRTRLRSLNSSRSSSVSSKRSVKDLVSTFEQHFSSGEDTPGASPTRLKMTDKRVTQEVSSTSLANVDALDAKLEEIRVKSVVASEVNQVLKDFISSTNTQLLDWINGSIAFSGFDAVAMRESLLKKLSYDQIFICIMIGLVRGNNVERIPKTIRSTEVKKKFELAITKAKIKPNVKGDYKAVTLSRVVACFPKRVVRILYAHAIPMAISVETLLEIHAEYPKVARHQVCACVVPDTLSIDEIDMALNVIMVPYMLVSEIINVKNIEWRGKTLSEKFVASEQYLVNSYNSRVVKAEDRIIIVKEIGMVVNGRLSSAWVSTAAAASTFLHSKFGKIIKS